MPLGWKGFAGVAYETTYGTAVAAQKYVPFMNESLVSDEGYVYPDSIIAQPYLLVGAAGRHSIKPSAIALHPDADSIGPFVVLANRSNTDSNYPPAPTSPSATAASGGTLTAGTYNYKLYTAYNITGTSLYFLGAPSAEFAGTTATTNLTLNLAWTNPTPPSQWTQTGTAIFRTAMGGATGTEKYLTSVSGTTAAYSDTGGVTLGTMAMPPATYKHSNTTATAALTSATLEIGLDGFSKQIAGVKVGELSVHVPAAGLVTVTVGNLIGQQLTQIASTSPTFASAAVLSPFIGHNSVFYMETFGTGDTLQPLAAAFDMKLSNMLEPIASINGTRTIRVLREGPRAISGQVVAQFETSSQLTQVLNDSQYALRCLTWSQLPVDGGTFNQTINAKATTACYAFMEVILPSFYVEIDAKVANKKALTCTLPFARALYDSTSAVDMTVNVVNTTANYAIA